MDTPDRPPLLPGRGAILAHELADVAGVDARRLAAAVESETVRGLIGRGGDAFGFVDDELPTRDDLVVAGLVPRADYDPADYPRGHTEPADDDEDVPDGASDTWTISWPDPPDGLAAR